MMDEGEIWRKYCSFFEKPFSEQVAYSEERVKRHFEKWKKTKTAKYLMMKYGREFERFEDIPLTTYEDYPILREFGSKIEAMMAKKPRKWGERLFAYYSGLFAELKPIIDEWMIDEFGYAAKTSGTTGEPKWIIHGVTSMRDYEENCVTIGALICSENWGETKVREGETGLQLAAPIPYISGWGLLLGSKYFNVVPSVETAEEVTDMGRRMWIILKEIERGKRPVFAAGATSFFQLVCRYLKNKPEIFREYYSSLNAGFAKAYMLFKWLSSYFGKKHEKLTDLLPLKGIGVAGVNIEPYKDFFVQEFGIEPTNIYGSTEFPVIMCGPPDRKECLIPNLRSGYYEFIDERGNLRRIDELKKGETYELVGTSIESILIRYRIRDLLSVVDFRDDGMPYFIFKSRVEEVLDFYGYFRLTERIFSRALREAGLKYFEKWAITKMFSGEGEYLYVAMEKPWEHSEEETARIIFEVLLKTFPDFQNYVRDFSVKNPTEIIKVKYLRKGAFLQYSVKMAKEGAEIGQIKPPKIVSAERKRVLDLLESI
ncbi:MAG: GH3 auxin-responsive promoter family protein [Candidatus Bathyarchaeia archaeon]